MQTYKCRLKKQGYSVGSCLVESDGRQRLACQATLQYENDQVSRLITSVHLSRPENYLSIYQSGCNFSCRKCHSWHFSKAADGSWYSPQDILEEALTYNKLVTFTEPRAQATAWHAHDSCRCCGNCVFQGRRSPTCPEVLDPQSIVLSLQGFGPARNIVAFTGGDVVCCPEFYGECARLIKAHTSLWVLLETNGYGLTPQNLEYLQESGVDSIWLDIKAFDAEAHRWLTGCSNDLILSLPAEIRQRDMVLEVLSLYIPGVVETEDLVRIAQLLRSVDGEIPFTLLAFFPEYRMKGHRSPTAKEMVTAYRHLKATGLKNIRLGNLGVFARTDADRAYLIDHVDPEDF
jgi:pyruvate-formate lyase-activating enzyme